MNLQPTQPTFFRREFDSSSPVLRGDVTPASSLAGEDRTVRRRRVLYGWAVALILCGYVVGASALAWTRMPQSDEGHFANAGYLLAHEGRLAMPMWTEWVSSLDRHMYVQMPLYYVQLAGWVALFGPDLRSIRFDSVLWGAVLVLAWCVIVRAVTGRRLGGLLGLALVAFNYDVINLTSARYDPMCAALSAAGVACYLTWREQHLLRAVMAANAAIAAAIFTHPFGIVGAAGFCVFFAALDLRRLSLKLVMAALVPYLVAAGAWAMYVLQDPAAFQSQLSANAKGRVGSLSHPIQLLGAELYERYLVRFAGWRPDVPALMRVKVIFLAAYAMAFAACLAIPTIRRRPAVGALATWAVVGFSIVALADSNRWYVYLIHVIPIYTALVAVWLTDLTRRGRWLRYAVAASVAGWMLFAVGTVGLRARLNDYGELYVPTMNYLRANVGPGDLVMAPGEFGPGLGFADHVLDDTKFGYRNGRIPDWIVYDKMHEERMAGWARTDPAIYAHVSRVLGSYELVLDNRQPYNYYRVYRRK